MKQDIDGYIKLSVLGRGAYSTIFLSRDRHTGEICAIKQVEIKKPEEMKYIGHLEQEHAIAAKFDHPVLRKTHKLIYNRKWFKVSSGALVMEYADGRPLAEMMPSQHYVRMLKIFRHVALGLDCMHCNRYVHADLKPENMIVNSQDQVKIIDYGQSFEMGQAKERVQGTVDYIAPEQTRREILDQRTDVFGLGAVMHRVFTNEPLQTEMNRKLNNHTLANVGKRVLQEDPLLTSNLPQILIKLISDCCQPERENRPANMRAVINMIELAIIKLHTTNLQPSPSDELLIDSPDDHSGEFPAIQFTG